MTSRSNVVTALVGILISTILTLSNAQQTQEDIRYTIVRSTEPCTTKDGLTCGGNSSGQCSFVNLKNITGKRERVCTGRGMSQTCMVQADITMVWTGQCTCNASFRGGGYLPCLSVQESDSRDTQKKNAQDMERRMQDRAAACTNVSMRFPCPTIDGVPASNQGQCKSTVLECFDNNATLARLSMKKQNCSSGQKLCPSVGCVDLQVDCTPVIERCTSDKPFRCRGSLECSANQSSCPTREDATCDGSKILCPDGFTCESNVSECAKRMSWNGPVAGMTECPQKRGVFTADVQNCTALTGCPQGTKFCGYRMTGTMVPMLNATTQQPIANCLPACRNNADTQLVSDFEQKIVQANGNGAVSAAVRREGTNATGAVFRVRAGGFHMVSNSSEAVNFSISAVPDSARDQGPFRGLLPLLVSPLITIKPSADVEAVGGGIVLEVPIEDASVTNASTCQAFLANLVVMSVDDIYDSSLVPVVVGPCSMGTSGDFACSCAVNISHFSTYGTTIYSTQSDVASTDNNTNSSSGGATSSSSDTSSSSTASSTTGSTTDNMTSTASSQASTGTTAASPSAASSTSTSSGAASNTPGTPSATSPEVKSGCPSRWERSAWQLAVLLSIAQVGALAASFAS